MTMIIAGIILALVITGLIFPILSFIVDNVFTIILLIVILVRLGG